MEKIQEKIQKLIALATSSNPHEAKLARDKAEELLTKHNLSMRDILNKGKETAISFFSAIDHSKNVPTWKLSLLAGISDCFDCGVLRNHQINKIQLIGMDKDIELAYHFYLFLTERISIQAKRSVRGRANINAFCLSAGYEIQSRLKEVYKKTVENSDCRNIVLAKKQLVRQELSGYNSTALRGKSTGDHHAFHAGRVAGRSIPLSNPITGKVRQSLT